MLQDWHMVILRPKHQAQRLVERLQNLGANAISVPLIDIIALTFDSHQLEEIKQKLHGADLLIVTSANAVYCAPNALFGTIKPSTFIITMGQATTDALQKTAPALSVHYTAIQGSTSESVLSESFLVKSQVSEKNICLLAGLDGRTLLADTLSERGAFIHWIKVYRQEKSTILLEKIIHNLKLQPKVCFIVTSSRILAQLIARAPQMDLPWLFRQPLIVVSQRIYQEAKTFGFEQVAIAHGASESAIEQACLNWHVLSGHANF